MNYEKRNERILYDTVLTDIREEVHGIVQNANVDTSDCVDNALAYNWLDVHNTCWKWKVMHFLGWRYYSFVEVFDPPIDTVNKGNTRFNCHVKDEIVEIIPQFYIKPIGVFESEGVRQLCPDMLEGKSAAMLTIRLRAFAYRALRPYIRHIVNKITINHGDRYVELCGAYALALLATGNDGPLQWAPKDFKPLVDD